MDDERRATILHRLASQYGIRVFRPGGWPLDDLERVLKAVEDLATLMGGSTRFRSEIRTRILALHISKWPRGASLAAMALPAVDIIYFKGASWDDTPELKWQTVHELAHSWDMRRIFPLSRGLKRATGGKCGKFTGRLPVFFEYEPGGTWLKGRTAPLNALEDWADSVATYVYPSHAESIPERLGGPRLISRTRWDYVRQHMQVKLSYPTNWDSRF